MAEKDILTSGSRVEASSIMRRRHAGENHGAGVAGAGGQGAGETLVQSKVRGQNLGI